MMLWDVFENTLIAHKLLANSLNEQGLSYVIPIISSVQDSLAGIFLPTCAGVIEESHVCRGYTKDSL